MQRPAGPQLPSIRTLHPYLPPPAAMDPSPSTSTANYMQTTSHAGGGGDSRYPASSYAGSEGDGDEREAAGNDEPPKKKRRRQALSCTECKRRKIRCDRAQPCGPCVKRGDQGKCQWHVVEPAILMPSSSAEKYVPRSEYDTLRGRVDVLEGRVNAFEDYIYRLPPQVLASHPLPPGLIPPPPPFNAEGQGFDPRQSPSFSQPQVHPRSVSASLSPAQRRASFSPTRTISIPPDTIQRRRSGSQHGHPEEAPPPLGTVVPSDIDRGRRAISSSPVHGRGQRSASFSAAHTTSPISAPQTHGGQWGEEFRSFPPASQTFSGPGASGSGRRDSDDGADGRGGNDTGASFSSFSVHAGPQDASSAPSRTLSTAPASASPSFSSPRFTSSSSFSPPHAPSHTTSASSSAFPPTLRSFSTTTSAIGGAGSIGGRSSAGSLSSLTASSGSAPGSVSSFSSATPTTYPPYNFAPPTAYIPPAPFPGDQGLYQHLPVHGSDNTAHALARIVRPDAAVGIAAGHASAKRAREDEAPKNRPAQAPQGARRLRAGQSAPCNRIPPRTARPPVQRQTPRPTVSIRPRGLRPERLRPIPATTRREADGCSWRTAMHSRLPRRRWRLLIHPPRSAHNLLRILRVPVLSRIQPRTRISHEALSPGAGKRAAATGRDQPGDVRR
ncbi:hypothetical protein B0H12DRAFT_102029 [Mycena haematopus]|nr:hypothetical protein B0H12DRAFT_102029 [Mycena haematopus]